MNNLSQQEKANVVKFYLYCKSSIDYYKDSKNPVLWLNTQYGTFPIHEIESWMTKLFRLFYIE